MEAATKDRPIIFSAPMVRALLDGRKTQTRRIVKPQPPDFVRSVTFVDGAWWENDESGSDETMTLRKRCPFGVPGDRLWVKERMDWRDNGGDPVECGHVYAATPDVWVEPLVDTKPLRRGRNIPSIHMPRWASRLTLTITDVRVERVQDISELDAREEGVDEAVGYCTTPERLHTDGFRRLWNLIHGPGAWERNDWVWALTFTTEVRK